MSKKFMDEVQLLHHFHNVFKGIHRTSDKKFLDFMQLSNQHHQVKICEASNFCIISELVAYKLTLVVKVFLRQVFLSLKLQEMCILAI